MKEAKFKVGDKVRILDGSKIDRYTGSWTGLMGQYVGKVATIDEVETFRCEVCASYRMKEFPYRWDERGLKLSTKKSAEVEFNEVKSVVIWRTGNRVYAKDTITKEQAVARCSPEDKFDFLTGAKLALERLEKLNQPLAVGDVVRVINTGKVYPSNERWINEHIEEDFLKIRFAYGQSLGYPETIRLDDKFRIRVIADGMAYIEHVGLNDRCHLIGLAGLERW